MALPSLADQTKVVAVIGSVALGSAGLAYLWSRSQHAHRKAALERKDAQEQEQYAKHIQLQPLPEHQQAQASHQHRQRHYRRVQSHDGAPVAANQPGSRSSSGCLDTVTAVRRATVDGSHSGQPAKAVAAAQEAPGLAGQTTYSTRGNTAQAGTTTASNRVQAGTQAAARAGQTPGTASTPANASRAQLSSAAQSPEGTSPTARASQRSSNNPNPPPASNAHPQSPARRPQAPHPASIAEEAATLSQLSSTVQQQASATPSAPGGSCAQQPQQTTAQSAPPTQHAQSQISYVAPTGASSTVSTQPVQSAATQPTAVSSPFADPATSKNSQGATTAVHARAGPVDTDDSEVASPADGSLNPGQLADDDDHALARLSYDWTQTHDEVVVSLEAPPHVRSSDIHCRITTHKLHLNIRDQTVLDGPLFEAVRPDDCNWEFDGFGAGRRLTVTLVKAHIQSGEQQWASVLKAR